MNSNVDNKVSELLTNGFKVRVGDAFDDLSRLLKGVFGYAFLAVVVYFLLSSVISLMVGMFFPSVEIDEDELEAIINSGNSDEIISYYKDIFTGGSFGLSTFLTNIISAILYPIIYSIYTMAYKFEKEKQIGFSDLFIHYKDGKFLNLFLVTVIIQIVSSIGYVLCLLPGFVVSSMWILAIPLVIFGNASVGEALNNSMKLAFKDFGTFLLFFLGIIGIGILCVIVGFILCCIGLFFTLPLFYIIIQLLIYSFYKIIVGFPGESTNSEEEIKDIYKDNPYMN